VKTNFFTSITGVFLFAVGLAYNASAEFIPGTNMSVNFESGHIVGSGRYINMQKIPVTDMETGTTTLYDASFKFSYSPDGQGFAFDQVTSATVSPPVIGPTNLVPGVYLASNDSASGCYILEGPFGLSEGRSVYTFKGYYKDDFCERWGGTFVGQFVTGSTEGNPDIGEREIVPYLQGTYLYGIVTNNGSPRFNEGSSQYNSVNDDWNQHELIGLRQLGNSLTISLFTTGFNNDGTPIDFKNAQKTVTLNKID